MPFKSKAQQRLFFAKERRGELPKGTALEWAHHTPDIKALPEHVKKEADAKQVMEALLPAMVGGVAGAGYGAYRAPGHSRLRGALIGGLGGFGAGAGLHGMNLFLNSPHAKNIENSAVRSAMVLGGTAGGLSAGLGAGRHLAGQFHLGNQRDTPKNDLAEMDPMQRKFLGLPAVFRDYLPKRAEDQEKHIPALSHESEIGIRTAGLKNNDVSPGVMQELDKLWPKSTAAKRDKTVTSLMFGKDANWRHTLFENVQGDMSKWLRNGYNPKSHTVYIENALGESLAKHIPAAKPAYGRVAAGGAAVGAGGALLANDALSGGQKATGAVRPGQEFVEVHPGTLNIKSTPTGETTPGYLEQAWNSYRGMPMAAQIGIPAAVAAGAYGLHRLMQPNREEKTAATLSPLPYKREHPWVLSISNGKSSISRPPIAGKPIPGLESQPSSKSKKKSIKADGPITETKKVDEAGNVKIAAVPTAVSSLLNRMGGAAKALPGQAMAIGRKAALPVAATGATAGVVHQMQPYYAGQRSLPDDITSGLSKLLSPREAAPPKTDSLNYQIGSSGVERSKLPALKPDADYQAGRMAYNKQEYGQPKAGPAPEGRTPGSVPPAPTVEPPPLSSTPAPLPGLPKEEPGMLSQMASAYGKMHPSLQYGIPAAAGLYALSRYMQHKDERQPQQGYPMMPMQMPMMGGSPGQGRMLLTGF